MDSKCIICIRFSQIFSGRPRTHPLLWEHKKLPSLAVNDPLQLSWKFSRNTYIEDRRFEGKNYTQFLGKKSTRTRQKWAQNAPFASIFQKFSQGDPDPPPLLQEHKNSPLWLYMILYSLVEISPAIRISKIGASRAKLHTIFGEEINTNSAKKMGSECNICIHFSNFFIRETPTPLLQEHKKLPSLAVYDPLQLSWKSPAIHISKIGALKAKITHNFWGRNQHELGKKWAQNAPFLSIFQKFQEHKNSPLWLYMILYS